MKHNIKRAIEIEVNKQNLYSKLYIPDLYVSIFGNNSQNTLEEITSIHTILIELITSPNILFQYFA